MRDEKLEISDRTPWKDLIVLNIHKDLVPKEQDGTRFFSPFGDALVLKSDERYEAWYKCLPGFKGESKSLGEAEIVPEWYCH